MWWNIQGSTIVLHALPPCSRVADPHHLNADSDLAFHFTADQDPTGHVYADPDHAPHESEANLRPLVYRPSRAPFLASTASTALHCSFWASKALEFWLFDPAFHLNEDKDPVPASQTMRILICNPVLQHSSMSSDAFSDPYLYDGNKITRVSNFASHWLQ